MKSERRHELQQNDLAIYLNRINRAVEPYSRVIAIVVGVVIVAAIALLLYQSQQSGRRSDATLQLIQAAGTRDEAALLTVSESFPKTAAGSWARLYQGKQLLSEGIQALYSDRENAEQLLGDAQLAFEAAISGSDDRLLRSRAQYGIARARESMGNLEEAIAAYQEVIKIAESEAMVEKAEDRIDDLSSPEAKNFMAWFTDQDFSPADPSLPPSMPGGDSLSPLPDLDLPELSPSTGENNTEGESAADDSGDAESTDANVSPTLPGGLELPQLVPSSEDDAAADSPDQASADPSDNTPPAVEETDSEATESSEGSDEADATEPPEKSNPPEDGNSSEESDQPSSDQPADDGEGSAS